MVLSLLYYLSNVYPYIVLKFRKAIMDNYTLKLDASWEETKELLKEANLELTDDDLDLERDGDRALLERLSQKMGRDVFAVKAWIESVSYNRGMAG